MANYFTDRVVQYPGRVTMTPVSGETNKYDMSRSEGTVTTDGAPFNAGAFNTMLDKYGMHYGTCSTSASTATKVVNCTGFALETGATIAVYFANGNEATSTCYMNVNNTGAKQMMQNGQSDPTRAKLAGTWESQEVKIFVYDGTYWRLVSPNIITNDGLEILENELGISPGEQRLFEILNAMIPKSGSNANGQYTKFPDGTMICTKKISGTYNFSVAFGSWWETASAVSLGDWPATFVGAPTIIATAVGIYASAEAFSGVTGTSAGVTFLMRPDKKSNQPITLALTAIGKWK